MTRLSRKALKEAGIVAQSELELAFETYLRMFEAPAWVQQYKFDDTRDWSFDFAWPAELIAVEIDGETVHGHWKTINDDREKGNAAATQGWQVLRFTGTMLTRDPASCVEMVLREIEKYRLTVALGYPETAKALRRVKDRMPPIEGRRDSRMTTVTVLVIRCCHCGRDLSGGDMQLNAGRSTPATLAYECCPLCQQGQDWYERNTWDTVAGRSLTPEAKAKLPEERR